MRGKTRRSAHPCRCGDVLEEVGTCYRKVSHQCPMRPKKKGLHCCKPLIFLWSCGGSNPGPHDCQSCALPSELQPQSLLEDTKSTGAIGGCQERHKRRSWPLPFLPLAYSCLWKRRRKLKKSSVQTPPSGRFSSLVIGIRGSASTAHQCACLSCNQPHTRRAGGGVESVAQ